MIIVDCKTFNAMNREYAIWEKFYTGEEDGDDAELPLQRAVNALLESLGTIISEAQVRMDDDDDQPDDVKEHEDFAGDNDYSQWECEE